jgi:hypothetical protein
MSDAVKDAPGCVDKILRHAVLMQGATRLIYTTDRGQYLGEVTITAANPNALRAFTDDVVLFLREAASPIVKATGVPPQHQTRQ